MAAQKKPATDFELPLRIIVIAPPKGVRFCLQSGKDQLVQPTLSTGADIPFDLTVRVKDPGNDQPPRFLGPFTQGPPDQRFIYVCSGTLAGQKDSPWTRRAKIPLAGISWPLIKSVLKRPATPLHATFQGTAKDGGPSCATVPLIGGWRIA